MAIVQNRRNIIIGAAVAAVVAIIAGVAVFTSGDQTVEPELTAAPTSTTTTTQPPKVGNEYTIATATVPVVQVVAVPPEGAEPNPLYSTRQSRMSPIPRADLASAGVRVTPLGYAFDNPTYFGNPLVMLVVSEVDGWVEVLLQARPNGQTGWVRTSEVELSTHDALLELDLTTRQLTATVDGEVIVDATTSIGLESNPTPTGTYYITEVIPQNFTGGDFGPFILATSAYSEELQLFDGGLPIVAVHGTNRPDLIGEMVTNGCVRLTNDLITVLAEKLPPGVPLVITESEPVDTPAT
jgi:lipoprotein-anchoring transpeptidase ErfK/SrfK